MAHYHVEKARGKAKDYPCVDCGGPARDWSRRHDTGTDERDVDAFDPRCRKCHMAYDDHKRDQRGKPPPAHVVEAARHVHLGNKYNLGRKRPDVVARNKGNHYAKPCVDGCTCGKHSPRPRRKSAAE